MIKSSIRNRIILLNRIATPASSWRKILETYPTPGPPSGYKPVMHLTPAAVARANAILATKPQYGYTEPFTDTKNGIEYHFIAKVEPHMSSAEAASDRGPHKGVSIYESISENGPVSDKSAPVSDKSGPTSSGSGVVPGKGEVVPVKGEFAKQFAGLSGAARDNFIIDYVEKFVDDIPTTPVTIPNPNDLNKPLTIQVQPTYFSIEGLPVQIGAYAAETIANILAKKTGKPYSLPTREIIDAVRAASTELLFKWQEGRLKPGSKNLLDYAELVAKLTKDVNLPVGLMKVKFLPLEGSEGNLHSAGLIGPNSNKFIQDYYGATMHDLNYKDYSEGTQYIAGITLPNGENISLADLIEKAKTNPEYRQYVTILTNDRKYSSYLKDATKDKLDGTAITPGSNDPAGSFETIKLNHRRSNLLKRAAKLASQFNQTWYDK